MSLLSSLVQHAQAVAAQINPLDNGRTYNTVMQHGAQYAPQAPQSALSQAGHVGAAVGNAVVQPVAQFGVDASNQLYNHAVAPVFHLPNLSVSQSGAPVAGLARYSGANGSLHQTIGSGIQTGLTIATAGLGGGLAGAAEKGGAAALGKLGASDLAAKYGASAATGGLLGAGFNAGSAIANGANAKQTLKAAAVGAGAGAGLGVAAPLAGDLTKVGMKAADNRTPLNQIGAVGKNVNQPKQPTFAVGQKVRAADQNNVGTVVKANPDGSYHVNFNNKANKTQATVKLPGEQLTPTGKAQLPAGTKQRGLTTGMKQSPEFSPAVQNQITSSYKPFTDKVATQSTDQFMQQPLGDAQQQVMQSLASGAGRHMPGASGNMGVQFGKQEVSNAGAVMKALDAKGDVAGAQAVHDLLAQKLTNAGQTSQAAQLIYNRTPQGLMNMAYRDLGKAGVNITPDLKAQLDGAKQAIQNAPSGSRQETLAKAQFAQLVGKNLPSTTGSKVVSLYKTGILSAPITAVKVGIVNPITNVLEQAKDIPAAAVDRAVSTVTGKRTVVAPNAQNIAAGLKTLPTAAQDMKQRFVNNIAMPGSTGMGMQELSSAGFEHPNGANFGINKNGQQTLLDKATGGASSKALNLYTSAVGRVHGSLQIPGYEARAAQSIMQQAQAEAINQGLKGDAKQAFIDKFVANPPKAAVNRAQEDAQYASSQQHTALGAAAGGLQRTMPGGQFIAPITRIPGAVATQMINYSPAGFLKTAGSAVADRAKGLPFDQREFSQGTGRAIVGSGLMAGGAAVAAQGRMSGGYPKDKGTQALWQAANIPENSIYVGGHAFPGAPWKNTGGKWEQIGSPGGAAAQSMLAGGAAYNGYKQGGIQGAALQGAQGGAQIATNQPYLTGISGAMGAINTPDQAKSFLDQTAGSVVPNFVRTFATATDPLQRQTAVQSPITSMKNSITNGIPGLREQNQPQVDVFGNTLQRNAGPVSTYLNPLKPQGSTTNPLVSQLGDVHAQQDVNGKQLTIPTQINKKYPISVGNGKKVPLSDAQRTQFIQVTGQASQQQLNQLINSNQYKGANAEQKSKMISDVVSGQRNLGVNQLSGGNTKLTSQGKAAQQGRLPTLSAAGKVTTSTGGVKINPKLDGGLQSTIKQYASMSNSDRNKAFATNNSAQYNYDNALYQNKLANGELTTAQKISGQQAIAKEKVGANYSQDVRQIYGLSKGEILGYLQSLPTDQANKLYSQLYGYGQDLKNGKFETSNKIATLFNGSSSGGSGGSSGSKSVTGETKAQKAITNVVNKDISETSAIAKKAASAKVSGGKSNLAVRMKSVKLGSGSKSFALKPIKATASGTKVARVKSTLPTVPKSKRSIA